MAWQMVLTFLLLPITGLLLGLEHAALIQNTENNDSENAGGSTLTQFT